MSSSSMRARSRWKPIEDLVVRRLESDPKTNQGIVFVVQSCVLMYCINYFNIFYRPNYPVKVHVWAGISLRGRTAICVFDGIIDAMLYTEILDSTLLPFIKETYPEGQKFFFKIMTQSTHLSLLKSSWKSMEWDGGNRQQSPQTWILLKICGTN